MMMVTLGIIHCDFDYISQLGSERIQHKKTVPSHWKFDLLLYYDALKALDPIPLINQILVEIQGQSMQRDTLNCVLKTLYNLSFEQGLLELDDKGKASLDNFIQFSTDKAARLEMLEKGFIKIIVSNVPTEQGGELSIVFEDSGDGFKDHDLSGKISGDPDKVFSNQLVFIKNSCSGLKYNEQGNRIECTFPWSV